jgi:hypothetical protein
MVGPHPLWACRPATSSRRSRWRPTSLQDTDWQRCRSPPEAVSHGLATPRTRRSQTQPVEPSETKLAPTKPARTSRSFLADPAGLEVAKLLILLPLIHERQWRREQGGPGGRQQPVRVRNRQQPVSGAHIGCALDTRVGPSRPGLGWRGRIRTRPRSGQPTRSACQKSGGDCQKSGMCHILRPVR